MSDETRICMNPLSKEETRISTLTPPKEKERGALWRPWRQRRIRWSTLLLLTIIVLQQCFLMKMLSAYHDRRESMGRLEILLLSRETDGLDLMERAQRLRDIEQRKWPPDISQVFP